MDRLAFIGHQGMGGLSYTPVSEFSPKQPQNINLATPWSRITDSV